MRSRIHSDIGETTIHRILVTAEVADHAKWEEGFLTHGELFRGMTATSVHYGTTGDNEIAVLSEAENLETYMEVLKSTATEDAMSLDGVKRETVKVFVLDREFKY